MHVVHCWTSTFPLTVKAGAEIHQIFSAFEASLIFGIQVVFYVPEGAETFLPHIDVKF